MGRIDRKFISSNDQGIKPPKGYRAAIQYIALNDEPTVMDVEEVCELASVQAIRVAFGKTDMEVAAAVVKWREKAKEDPVCPNCGKTDACGCE